MNLSLYKLEGELALLDNTIITKRIDTDSLTNTLNRNALENIFKNQYELSLSTQSSLILAMYDLDFFKNQEIHAILSTGVVHIIPQESHKKGLLNKYITIADQRLYKAKRSGRNKLEFNE